MKKLIIASILVFVSTTVTFAVEGGGDIGSGDTPNPALQNCISTVALTAGLPTEFPGLYDTQDPAADRVYKNMTTAKTSINQAVSAFCVQNQYKPTAPVLPENPKITKCVQELALNAALPTEFLGLDEKEDPVGNEVYKRLMNSNFPTYHVLVAYCTNPK